MLNETSEKRARNHENLNLTEIGRIEIEGWFGVRWVCIWVDGLSLIFSIFFSERAILWTRARC